MVIAIVITNKVKSKLLPKQTLFCQASATSPRQETLQLLDLSPMNLHLKLKEGKKSMF